MDEPRLIEENLSRQAQALACLLGLLQEEFALLGEGRAQDVTQLELCIQELMRQIMAERLSLRRFIRLVDPNSSRLSHISDFLRPEARERCAALAARLDATEQRCAIQAEQNRLLALALHEQSTALLGFLHQSVAAPPVNTYGAQGRMTHQAMEPRILRGRF